MKLKKHDCVKVISLARDGEILEVMRSGQYRVAVGDLTLVCEPTDLSLVPGGRTEKRKASRTATKMKRQRQENLAPVSHSVDLHGLTVVEALKLVENRIDRALLDGADSLRVLHGVGTGRLKDALYKYLPTVSVVKHFKLEPDNPGVTWIYF